MDAEFIRRKTEDVYGRETHQQRNFSENTCGSESPGLKLFCGWEITKGGTINACPVPTPTQSTCLHCGQDFSGLSLHSACMDFENESVDERAKRMHTKHIQLKSAAKRTSPLLSIMQSFRILDR